ncbi:AlbA family DNA-binding domain-containing protein [Bradyrhizobium aeschynomenes]|uniref:AlbA family DNA-binding domain-containing protein n=1 Tax=Bradyrhizobium aeschynomenes TaxID=2734909 RepID=UPI00155482B2|nr:ATP-binding protein [Bradyrhizobium aeschynomenes]NPV19947.1 ATP-binding protein [Bradyrhizobium aeschynomenes]
MDDVSDRLKKYGFEIILKEGWSESLHLEFKTLSDASGVRLNKDDRRTIAKALCGLCNADGGHLIVGVETEKQDGLDTAVKLAPVEDARRLASIVAAALPDLLQPRRAEIQVQPVITEGERGLVVVRVDQGTDRPFMSIPHNQFFRRTFDSTRLLDRSEIRDIFFATRDASLKSGLVVIPSASTGDHYFWMELAVTLQNNGNVVARAPYVTITPNSVFNVPNAASVSRRLTKKGRVGYYTLSDVLLHIDDELTFGTMKFGLRLHNVKANDRAAAIDEIKRSRNESLFSLNDAATPSSSNPPRLPNEVITFGAANAAPREARLSLTSWDLFDLAATAVSP